MSTKKLSATMAAAIVEMKDRGGVLHRRVGGFWTVPGEPYAGTTVHYAWYLGTSTVQALVDRGLVEYSEWQDGRNGRFPVAALLKPEQERAKPDGVVVCGDCGAAPAVCIVDTQRAEGTYPMCAMCAHHSVKNRGMRYVMAGERSAGARLAPPPAMAPGSTEPARTPGDHKTQEEN